MSKNFYIESMTTPSLLCGSYYTYSTSYPSDKTFDNYDDALKAAKKMVMQKQEDVVIKADYAVVKFPVPDIEVEILASK